jgi:hypothetical protein
MGTREIIIKSGGEIERLKREFQSLFTDSLNTEIRIMRKRLLVVLGTVIAFGLAPAAALAETCGNYPLTPAQSEALQEARLEVVVPEGNVPAIQRCDTNSDGAVDIFDIRAISMHRNQPAAHPDDPMDWDQNSVISVLDARGCVLACDLPRCAVSRTQLSEPQTKADVTQDAQCFQRADLDGDGKQDFLGIFEYVGNETRGNNWDLQTVILYEDAAGDTQVIAFPYTGQSSRSGSQIFQHVSLQPAGPVDLNPGGVMLSRPGIVSYRYNQPKTLYYFQGGRWNRAYYGVDD